MTKQDSLMLKGIAILMMLFLHLFNRITNCSLCYNLITIHEIPLSNILSRVANPVSFFLFLSGYGLYCSYKSKGNANNVKRLLKLYLHFWTILSIFLILGCILRPEKYPGTITEIVGNYTSFVYSYNGEYWFLFPYAILALISPFLFKYFERVHFIIPILMTLFINLCTSFAISRFGERYIYNNPLLYNPLLVFHMLFPFTLGMICAKHNFGGIVEKMKKLRGFVLWLLLFAIIAAYCVIPNYATHIIYLLIFIILFLAAPKARRVKHILVLLGKHSMNMWLIHTWFCYYLFKDFIYGFKYPLIVFVILILCSLIVSVLINKLLAPLEELIQRH